MSFVENRTIVLFNNEADQYVEIKWQYKMAILWKAHGSLDKESLTKSSSFKDIKENCEEVGLQ